MRMRGPGLDHDPGRVRVGTDVRSCSFGNPGHIYKYDDFNVCHEFDGNQDTRIHDPPRPHGDFAPVEGLQSWGRELRSAPQRSPRRPPTRGVLPRALEEAEPGTPAGLV